MHWEKKLFNKWVSVFRKIEGPELEPTLWHSHYLTTRFSEKCLTILGRKLQGKVLDVGAGTGHGAKYLNKDKTVYYPTDLPSARDSSDETISMKPEKMKVCCSCYELPFPNESMEGMMFISVLEHLENPPLALREAHRVMASGGDILISTPFIFPVHGFPMDFKRWTLEGLKLEVKNAGFECLEGETIGNTFASLALNINLLFKYHMNCGKSKPFHFITALAMPMILIMQFILNIIAIALGPLDKSNALSLGVAVLGKKRKKTN
jgi:SAM-dependent methyltransferase